MVSVQFETRKENREVFMIVRGHAGQAEKGKDIICSAVSILAYTVAEYVELMNNQGDLAETPIIQMKDGITIVSCVAKTDDAYSFLLQAFYVCRLGYMLLAQNYPQYVEIFDVDGFLP